MRESLDEEDVGPPVREGLGENRPSTERGDELGNQVDDLDGKRAPESSPSPPEHPDGEDGGSDGGRVGHVSPRTPLGTKRCDLVCVSLKDGHVWGKGGRVK